MQPEKKKPTTARRSPAREASEQALLAQERAEVAEALTEAASQWQEAAAAAATAGTGALEWVSAIRGLSEACAEAERSLQHDRGRAFRAAREQGASVSAITDATDMSRTRFYQVLATPDRDPVVGQRPDLRLAAEG